MKRRPMAKFIVTLLSLAFAAIALGSGWLLHEIESAYGLKPFGKQLDLEGVRAIWQGMAEELLDVRGHDFIYYTEYLKRLDDISESGNLRFTMSLREDGEIVRVYDNAELDDVLTVKTYRVAYHSLTNRLRFLPTEAYRTTSQEQEGALAVLVQQSMPVFDEYAFLYMLLQHPGMLEGILFAVGAGLILWLICVAWLLCAIGHGPLDARPMPNLLDRVPLELLLACTGALIYVATYLRRMDEWLHWLDWTEMLDMAAAGGAYLLGLTLLLTLVNRRKCGILRETTLAWRIWRLLCRLCGFLMRTVPAAWQVGGAVLMVLLANVGMLACGSRMGGMEIFCALCLLPDIALVLLALWWGWNVDRLGKGIAALRDGKLDRMNTDHMPPKLRNMARQLGEVGEAIDQAVEARTRSERMKTELISNVSHDLKTPLTSLINYVDLLRNAPTDAARAEYVDVLSRQANRLKKLTEDLVEASKASSGAIAVELQEVSIAELLRQALAEYEGRFAANGLELIAEAEELTLHADGRLLWRVLDNLLSNIHKYAMRGSRVYIDARRAGEGCRITFKNISAQRLNVPEDELMERFVRGDSSRNAEGSGLGLGIARSLMELMGGTFAISVDGDLFKAELTLPCGN